MWAMAQKGHELEVGWGMGEVIVGGRGRKGRLLVRIGLGWIVVVVVMNVMDTTGYRAAEPRCVFWQQRGAERHGHGSCE